MKKIFPLLLLLAFSCKEEAMPSADHLLEQMNTLEIQISNLLLLSCDSSDQCIATPMGIKPCGGPAKYLVHASHTDQEALDELIDQYNVLNRQYNEVSGTGSDCSIVTPPAMDCVTGNCTAMGN